MFALNGTERLLRYSIHSSPLILQVNGIGSGNSSTFIKIDGQALKDKKIKIENKEER